MVGSRTLGHRFLGTYLPIAGFLLFLLFLSRKRMTSSLLLLVEVYHVLLHDLLPLRFTPEDYPYFNSVEMY